MGEFVPNFRLPADNLAAVAQFRHAPGEGRARL
jgi:hypothetical protein